MRSFHPLSLLSSIFLFSCFPSQVLCSNRHENPSARYRHVNNFKRDENGAFTYFADGQGACGITNGPNDFIVALNSAEFNGGAHCFDMITITVSGKTAVAEITDECVSCLQGGLDFSPGLFQYFAPLIEGKIYGSWVYNSDISTSSTLPPSTTSTSGASTSVTTIATTTSLSTNTMTLSTAMPSQTSVTSTIYSSAPQASQVIAQIDLALLQLGSLLQASVCS